MFEKYLERLLKESLGDYLEEVDAKELNVGIWSGKIDIKNLRFKRNFLQKYNLPIKVKYSSVKGLTLKIPWKSLFTSPLVITVDSLFLLCEFDREGLSSREKV